MRLAEADYFQRRYRAAADRLRPILEKASRRGEALYYYAVSIRALGRHSEYIGLARRIAVELPTESWAEEALNNLATHYILIDDDEKADQVFREMYEKYPRGRYAERAAWKAGWWAFRTRRYADTVKYFERAAVDFPRSDYRPSWIYWAGRAHEALGQRALAEARFLLTATDYQNSYYGRLALSRLNDRRPEPRVALGRGAGGAVAGPQRADHSGPARDRSLPGCAQRARVRPEAVGRFLDAAGDDGLDVAAARPVEDGHRAIQPDARRDQHDAAGVPAVHGRGRGRSATRRADGHLPVDVQRPHREVLGGERSGSVSRGRAHGAGIDLRARHPLVGWRCWPDAVDAAHRPTLRARA